ncbi:hypothetical protein KGA66_19200 [Actinocrinis puniceicyclus]|uniref:Uncharacterized protein n=1 Tax=Actinocrinis puniceicyclus TaxID=977794 RepID=A0A8J7WMN0_9ACTN|nr:hypothetical protein [Actinocrinis puniceicyclus]MBS2965186.1 hypothetical protein [Actinocrinis puniceicyclus]
MIETGHRTDPLTQAVAFLAATYRSLPQSKLLTLLPDGRSRARAGHRFAELLAAMAQGVEERARETAPQWRELPFDGHFIVGDQIAVTGHDLVAGMRALGDLDEPVWSVEGGRVAAGEVLEAAVAAANRLRGLM